MHEYELFTYIYIFMEEGLMEDGETLIGTRDCSVDEADIFSSFAVLRWDR